MQVILILLLVGLCIDAGISIKLPNHHRGATWLKSLQAAFDNFSSFTQYQQCSANVEKVLFDNEQAIWTNYVNKIMIENNISIALFFHVSTVNQYWREVVAEQLYLLDGRRKACAKDLKCNTTWYDWKYTASSGNVGLLHSAVSLTINVATTASNHAKDVEEVNNFLTNHINIRNREKIHVQFTKTLPRGAYKQANDKLKLQYEKVTPLLSEGEFSTFQLMEEYCSRHSTNSDNRFIVYIHNKASCCTRHNNDQYEYLLMKGLTPNISDFMTPPNPAVGWREEMNTFILEFPSICFRALQQFNYSACGVESHFAIIAGNFFWSRCSHIDHLPKIDPRNRFDVYAAERYIFNVSKEMRDTRRFSYRCAYSPLRCAKYHYNVDCHRDSYRDRLLDFYPNISSIWNTCSKYTNSSKMSFPVSVGSSLEISLDGNEINSWPGTATVKNTKYNTTDICSKLRLSERSYYDNSKEVQGILYNP